MNSDLKKRILDISYRNKLSHLGSCLTSVDIIEEIYQIKKPEEKFILSSGHAHLAHAVVIEKYWGDKTGITRYDAEENIRKFGIHCEKRGGCDCSTGSLGQGLPIAVGMALAERRKNVYCLISDGECSEGSIWEALDIADEQELSNIKIYINCNGWGAYKKIARNHLVERCRPFTNINITFRQTGMQGWPDWLHGQQSHYVVMDEKKYKEALACL